MYAPPASPPSTRVIGATIACVVTSAAIYATSVSHLGFGHSLSKPVDFVGSASSEASIGEPDTIMVPDTAIAAAPPSAGSSNVVRESQGRLQTIVPGGGDGETGWSLDLSRIPLISGPGVVQPKLKSAAAPARFPLPSLAAGEAGTTTMS